MTKRQKPASYGNLETTGEYDNYGELSRIDAMSSSEDAFATKSNSYDIGPGYDPYDPGSTLQADSFLPDDEISLTSRIPYTRHRRSFPLSIAIAIAGVFALVVVIAVIGSILAPRVLTLGDSPTAAAKRFIVGLEENNEEKMKAALAPEMRDNLSGMISSLGIQAFLATGIKVQDVKYTESGNESNKARVNVQGFFEYELETDLATVSLRRAFSGDMVVVLIKDRWYINEIDIFSLSE